MLQTGSSKNTRMAVIYFAVFAVMAQNRKKDFAVNFALESNRNHSQGAEMYKKERVITPWNYNSLLILSSVFKRLQYL